ncbi:MAG: 2OG-Fe(II) oxygenase [Bacteroidia bacterium]|nr:2OG-Fe(II) oxygenase [Bacteroidia bacterium]
MPDPFEQLVDGLLAHNYGQVGDFLDPPLIVALRHHLLDRFERGKMHEAGIGNQALFQKNKAVRGDFISWIDETTANEDEQKFLRRVNDFVEYLNRTCYAGIRSIEFHYALYPEGSFYRRHKDQFRTDSGRKFSLITYLNEDWREADGGQLVLYGETEEKINPQAGRAVFFRADEIEHEVLEARRPRMSLTGWLKNR